MWMNIAVKSDKLILLHPCFDLYNSLSPFLLQILGLVCHSLEITVRGTTNTYCSLYFIKYLHAFPNLDLTISLC